MNHYPDADDNDAQAYDDRNAEKSTHDEPRGTPPIIERPENTHIGYSEPDPAIDDAEPVAIFE
jgi:hypothetical protein